MGIKEKLKDVITKEPMRPIAIVISTFMIIRNMLTGLDYVLLTVFALLLVWGIFGGIQLNIYISCIIAGLIILDFSYYFYYFVFKDVSDPFVLLRIIVEIFFVMFLAAHIQYMRQKS